MRAAVAFVSLLAACSTSSVAGQLTTDASSDAAVLADVQALPDAAVDGGSDDAPACLCPVGGACNALGCPPDYNDAASLASWCATVQASAVGHTVTTKSCGTALLLTYGTDAGCESGYVFDQTTGEPVAAVTGCSTSALTCAALGEAVCMPPCCLEGTCTLELPSLCP
jgi:hypothetical protein